MPSKLIIVADTGMLINGSTDSLPLLFGVPVVQGAFPHDSTVASFKHALVQFTQNATP